MEATDTSAREERLYEVLLDYLESSDRGVPPDATEWLARHPEYATELKEFLATHNRIENLAAPVRQLSGEILNVGRSSQGGLAPPAPVSIPVGPVRSARQFDPEARRIVDELTVVLRPRLLAGTIIGAALFAVMIPLELASPRGSSDHLSLTLYTCLACWYGALTAWLIRQRDMPLFRLRVIEVLALAAFAASYAWKDFSHYSRYWEVLKVSEQWLLVTHSCFNWGFLIVLYAVLIPNDWRRALRVSTGIACIPLAVYTATWLSLPASHRPGAPVYDLFAMARLLAATVAIASFGAHKLTTLRQEAYEARHLGNYRIKHRLSAGGMGEVYLAEHRSLNRPYAIKLIRPELAANPTNRSRFEREIRAMARLTHWNTIEIIDYGHAPDGTFYFVMEYVEGPNLRELVDRTGPVNPGRAVYLLRQVCASLAEAHAAGLIHRDIKPGNIMLTQQAGLADVVKILDFGLVQHCGFADGDDKLTRTGMVVGTLGYISPEQATGVADARSDIYSLGAVGYFLLSGQTPFSDRRLHQIAIASGLEPTPLRERCPEVPADLEGVIHRCLRRDPDDRFKSILLVDQALAACACASTWSSADGAAWWKANPARASAAMERPAGTTPSAREAGLTVH